MLNVLQVVVLAVNVTTPVADCMAVIAIVHAFVCSDICRQQQ
jgi:hypothetical protein